MSVGTSLTRGACAVLAASIAVSCLEACRDCGDRAEPAAGSAFPVADATLVLDASLETTSPEGQASAASEVAPCSSPGYGPGPDVRPVTGQPAFVVLFNCLWPSHQRMEISVSLVHAAKRADVLGLLKSLWKSLQTGMGKGFPETAKLCVLAPDAHLADAKPLGCLKTGYEPEGEPGEEEADLEMNMPPEPAELAAGLSRTYGKAFVGKERPRVTFDPAERTLTMVYPYVEAGSDRWAAQPTYADITLPFFALAWEFYPPKTELSGLTYQGVWKGKTLFRVRVRDLQAFLAMDPWATRERLNGAHLPLGLGASRTPEESAALQKELGAALAKLPKGSVLEGPLAP